MIRIHFWAKTKLTKIQNVILSQPKHLNVSSVTVSTENREKFEVCHGSKSSAQVRLPQGSNRNFGKEKGEHFPPFPTITRS